MKKEYHDRWDFNRWAARYDQTVKTEDWMYRDYDRILDEVVHLSDVTDNPGLNILEIGAGTGNLTRRFQESKSRIVVVEPSTEMRKKGLEKCPGVKFVDGHFLSLPFPDAAFNRIVSTFAFHHLTEDEKVEATNEMKRVLRPGGKIVVADLMFKDTDTQEKMLAALQRAGREDIIEDVRDEYYGLFEDLKGVFTQAGFSFSGKQLTDFVWIFQARLKEGR